MPQFTIRCARPTDSLAVSELFAEMIDYHADRDSLFARTSDGPALFARWFVGQAGQQDSLPLVAVVEDRVVAYALGIARKRGAVYQERDYGEVNDLAVAATFQREGIGAGLVRVLRDWFATQGLTRIEAKVATTNEVALRFWRRMGLRPYIAVLTAGVEDVGRDLRPDDGGAETK